ncbi:MAG: DNA methyltransferase [Peptoniphilaceae bacterium]|nr:DNA methyltransferase [Peptoniphilaceae bacterium]MDY5842551.1 DNA methyltransferase [Peptoniphilaceae bacterium]
MLKQAGQQRAAKAFAERWFGHGYEKGESQRFWMSLLNEVYGVEHPAEFITFEEQTKGKIFTEVNTGTEAPSIHSKTTTNFIDAYIPATHVMIEQKSLNKDLRRAIRQSDGSLLTPFQQAKRYASELPYSQRPRWIIACNFAEFHIYDMEKPGGEPEVVLLKDLEQDYYRLNFLVDTGDEHIQKEMEVSLQAGELVGVLYNALLKQYQNPDDDETLKDLNVLSVRLVFCLYAEDAGLFGKHGMFHDYLARYQNDTGMFRDALIKLFRVLDQKPEERDPYLDDSLAAFPYVNGGLFSNEQVVIPRISPEIIDILLNKASADFDWSQISPTIFGAVFESTLNPETRRAGGMHYTSIENIHKVIDPLFLDDLCEELEEIKSIGVLKTRNAKLLQFQEKLASLEFLDPAAGSGNFLTETYLSLRRIENEILSLLYKNQMVIGGVFDPIKVSISQFHGIEINDFAVTVAKTALWIAESQMMKETAGIVLQDLDFLPLKTNANIVEGNALRLDWEDVVPKEKLDYIMGNPPFVGGMWSKGSQRDDITLVFPECKKPGKVDYVAGWYVKAAKWIQGTQIRACFVSTNSITQGQQVWLLWEPMLKQFGMKIDFGYRTFIWDSEASLKAHVHCVIVGFSDTSVSTNKAIYDGTNFKRASHINGYLADADDVFIVDRKDQISGMPPMHMGVMARDGGHLIMDEDEYQEYIKQEPQGKAFIHRYMMGRELIHNIPRYCFWLVGADPVLLRKCSLLLKRVDLVRQARLESSAKETQKLADTPTLFAQLAQPTQDFLAFPKVSSERRSYIPITLLDKDVIVGDMVYVIENAGLFEMAVMTSNVHNAWMRTVAGRLKSDYRYSNTIVYNNFPWPIPTDVQKAKIEQTAQAILDARALYPAASLADLYDPLTMPPELRKAHQENDKAVMTAYGFNWRTMTSAECVAELMKMYQKLVNSNKENER